MAELIRSLIAKERVAAWYPNMSFSLMYTILSDDSPMRASFRCVFTDRHGVMILDRRAILSKWIHKHYSGTKKSII